MSVEQLPIAFAAESENTGSPPLQASPLWLGLILDHCALCEALQDDWLRPLEGKLGHDLGVRAFARGTPQPTDGHRIFVRVKFDSERLPRIPVYRGGADGWKTSSINSNELDDEVVFWPGPLPTFAITELLTESEEQTSRLASIVRQVSNISLPVVPRVARSTENVTIHLVEPPADIVGGIELPPGMDAVRGAMAMAMWAVPRIDPWLDVLCESLGSNQVRDSLTAAMDLCSPWWTSPPWFGTSRSRSDGSLQERLWLSATRTFQCARTNSLATGTDMIFRIAAEANQDLSDEESTHLQDWIQETSKVLRGDARLDLSAWKAGPVGKAIQLVLLRPDPSAFKKWKDDLPSLPPSVWWSAAALCGLLHGYRRLPIAFKGDSEQRCLFAIQALRFVDAAPDAENWAVLVQGKPEWRRQSGDVIFSWAGVPFAQKSENARGQWFTANLNDLTIKKAAEEISRSNEWACIKTKVVVPTSDIPFSGKSVKVIKKPHPHLALASPAEFVLPLGTTYEQILDPYEFRRCIATEGAAVSPPGEPKENLPSTLKEISGLAYVSSFLSETQEVELIKTVDASEWSDELKRRVQHFGWRYDYKNRQITSSMRLGPLPEWAMVLARRLKEEGLLPHVPDQVIVNEYVGNQGISKHIDCPPCFEDGIAMISLLESWEMVFRRGVSTRISKLLEHGSVAIMTGEARSLWSHEIPARSTEPNGLKRHRRVSVTFRKVREAGPDPEPRRPRRRQSI